MKVYTRNLPENVSKKLVESAINFYASELLSKKLCSNITVFLRYKHFVKKYKNHFGFCEAQLGFSPRVFWITMCAPQTKSKKIFLEVLGHEMIHLRQFATNELRFYGGKRCDIARFQKKIYSKQEPWEKEPYRRAPTLYKAFMRKRNDLR